MEALELLRRNSPNADHAEISLRLTEISDAELSDALSRNQHVKTIELELPDADEQGRNWDLLLRGISTRAILNEINLSTQFYWPRNPPEMAERFLQSIQLNPSIHTVRLCSVRVSRTALASFLDEATYITTFGIHGSIDGLNREASEVDQGAIDLASSIQRNTRIR
jgi:hypothetical protein